MRKFLIVVVGFMFIFFSIYSFGVLAAYLILYKSVELANVFKFNVLWFDGHGYYFAFLTFIVVSLWIDIILVTYFNKKDRAKRKAKRQMNNDEKLSYSKLSTIREAKKGLIRLDFTKAGYIKANTIYDKIDRLIDPFKRSYNKILDIKLLRKNFNIRDYMKVNTVRTFTVNGINQIKSAGLPIITKRNTIWVDPGDSHNLIIGTTGSGKSESIINAQIAISCAAGENMVITDVKKELLVKHKMRLQEHGYKVIEINFIEPEYSDYWNPFGIVIKKWREAENNAVDEHVDYSEALELLKDIADTLTYESEAKDPYWNDQAKILIEGLVAFLLEEKTIDIKTGEVCSLPDEIINMKSVKILHQQGNKLIGKNQTLLGLYLEKYRRPTDVSVSRLSDYIKAPEKTKGSIDSVFGTKTDILTINERIMGMTSRTEFDVSTFGNEKTAIFLVVHDEKRTYHSMINIFVSQLYMGLIKTARNEVIRRLPIPMNLIMDEAGTMYIKQVPNIIQAGRSRGVRLTMVVQDFSQLDDLYGKSKAKFIKDNMNNVVYLLGGDPETLKEVSSRAGQRLVWNKEKESYEHEAVLSADRLSRFDMGEAAVLRQRKNAFVTRLIPYRKFCFYEEEVWKDKEPRLFKEVPWFDIQKCFNNRYAYELSSIKPRTTSVNEELEEKGPQEERVYKRRNLSKIIQEEDA